MSRISPVVLLIAVPTLLVGGLLWSGASAEATGPSSAAVLPKTESSFVAGYKKWQRVNPTPHRVWSRLAALCMTPTPQQVAQESANPHTDKFVTVYVNTLGAQAMMHAKMPRFPQGTVIVKEKAASATSGTPELLTVMRKREPGYDPAHGDWQYLVLSGTATRIQAEGRLQNCQSCHSQWRKTDYVSREYLPASAVAALRE